MGEFSKVTQTGDVVNGWYNFREFSQPSECLDDLLTHESARSSYKVIFYITQCRQHGNDDHHYLQKTPFVSKFPNLE